jgi:hypothetical protein
MAYIGKSIESGTFSVLDTSGNTYNGSNTTFNLGTQVGSVAQLLVSHDGVIQKPGTDYTLASGGTQITFTTAPASGASIFIVEISGAVGGPLDADLNGTELILDADGDTSITADTDDQIDIKIAGDDDFTFTASTLTVNSTNKICFNDATQFIQGASGTVLDIAATDEIELNATAIDLNGTLDVSGTSLLTGRVGVVTAGDLGTGIHVRTADSGASVNSNSDELVLENSGDCGLSILSATNGKGIINFGDSGDNDVGQFLYEHDDNSLRISVNGDEAIRIASTHSTNINYGNNSNAVVSLYVNGHLNNTVMALRHGTSSSTEETLIAFTDGADQASGSIKINPNANTVSYNTSSDYRLKENVNYGFDATTELKKLKPAKFNWKTNPDLTIEGFLAHEVSDVVPLAVQGTKDETEVIPNGVYNANGNLHKKDVSEDEWIKGKASGVFASDTTWSASKTIPKYQVIDQAKLVPLLVKTVQELEARIATLEG